MSFGKNSGQFFSLITVIMIIPLVALSVTFTQSMSGYGEEIGELVKLKSSYYYYHSVDQDLLRAGEIVGKRSLVAALNHVVEGGEGLNSSKDTLEELFKNGSINSTSENVMNRSTIYDWLNRTEEISRKRGYILDFGLEKLKIGMESPFKVNFKLNYSLRLSDRNHLFALDRNLSKNSPVSIQGLEDPLVTLRTEGKLSYQIEEIDPDYFVDMKASGNGNNSWSAGESIVLPSNETTIEGVEEPSEKILVTETNVSKSIMNNFAGVVLRDYAEMSDFDRPYVVNVADEFPNIKNHTRIVVEGNESRVWEIENLYSTWKRSKYFGGFGPSFMDRLENNLTGSGHGMGVFIKKEDLEDSSLNVKDRPNLAHIYFSDETVDNYRVKGMPSSFKVNESNLDRFNLDNTLSFG